MEKYSKDAIAQKLWRRDYDQLSEWGRRKVDHISNTVNPQIEEAPVDHTASLLQQENLRLSTQLEQARLENLDLWEELSEAKAELEELRASFNQPS